MKKLLLSLLCSAFLFQSYCGTNPGISDNQYVKVKGMQFVLDGKPFYFVGTNFWYGCYIGSSGETGDRNRLIRELDRLQALGITHLRIMAGSQESYIKNSLKPAIEKSPGVYDQNLLDGVDYLLAEMGKRNMKAILFLNNYWEWSGGMAQYNAWAGDGKGADPEGEGGWSGFMTYSAKFYSNPKAVQLFKNFITDIITRKNKVTGYYYYEDPVIMAWQLANEPRPGTDEEGLGNAEHYYAWIDSTAGYIHSIDRNHLVTTGSEGLAGSLQSEEVFVKAHQSANIDFLTFHLWVKNWGWFNANKIEQTYSSAEKKAVEYMNRHFAFARKLGKPITLDEFGMARDNELCVPGSASTARDKYFKKIFEIVYDSAAVGSPIAGSDFWAWGGEGRGWNADDKWLRGDPFVGDPPQEPQGLNSVFDVDASTLEIIKFYSGKMQNLCK